MKSRSRGTTLMELMAALTVLGILVAIAVPSFRSVTANSRTAASTNDLVTALNLARSEALRRSSSVTVCASANLTTCSGSSNWATGWIAYEDRNGNGTFETGSEPLLRVWDPVSNGITVTASGASNSINNRVTFNTMGMGTATIQFDLVPAGCVGATGAGRTNVLMTGAVRSTKVACP